MKMVSFKLPADAVREIDSTAAIMHLNRSDYLRAVVMNGVNPKPQESFVNNAELADIKFQQAEITAGFNALLDRLSEFLRVPTFREYRGRRLAEDPIIHGENPRDFLIRIAQDYYRLYNQWPDQTDKQRFGSVPDNGFPKTRPHE